MLVALGWLDKWCESLVGSSTRLDTPRQHIIFVAAVVQTAILR